MARPVAPARPPRQAPQSPVRRRLSTRRAKLATRVLLALATTFIFVIGWSLGHALTYPGGGSVPQRVAEWARNHYMGPLVTFGEWLIYTPPKVGGKPTFNLNKLGGSTVSRTKVKPKHHGILPIIPPNIPAPPGLPPYPGEGVWKVAVSVHGVPAVFKTYVRESKTYSSYIAGIVSMDPRLLKFDLRPGSLDPGYGNWGVPMDIPAGQRQGLVATFNSGFRIASALGGFYLNGHYDGTLVKGAASEVYYRNGQMKIGAWGSGGLKLGPNVVGVRQNLRLIIQNGKIAPNINSNVESNWGATLGGSYFVWRSGIGVTKDGRIVYVYAPELNAQILAQLLKRAGCVTAMELDINPDWMSFEYYLPKNHPGNPTPVNLLPNQLQPAYRYYSISNRDFTAVFAR
ncbi:MAG: phosphodiester glycosidase family protein [Actinomycetota bacterium]|nr:phosphodiester glycosidase family protein [Actinomycetota bacterium]